MKKVVCILWLLLLSSNITFAQKYSTAVGLRISNGQYGISAKQRILRSLAAEGIITAGEREIVGTVLLQKHFPLLGRGLNVYLGVGAHAGGLKDFGPTFGVDAMVGAEIKVPLLPLTASVDFKPAYHILHEDWFDTNTAVSVRYIIGKDKKKQRQRARKKRKKRREREKEKKDRKDKDDATIWEKLGLTKDDREKKKN